MAGLRFIIADDFNNPNLPVIDLNSPLWDASALGIYEMNSLRDASGHNKDLATALSLTSEGLYTPGGANHYADTGIREGTDLTVVLSIKIEGAPAITSQIYSSLTEASSPFSGTRLAVDANRQLIATVGTTVNYIGLPSGTVVSSSTPLWSTFAFSTNATSLKVIRSGGEKYEAQLGTQIKNPAKQNIRLLGGYSAPHDQGPKSTIGCIGIYNRYFSDEEMSAMILKAKKVMAKKGIIVP